GDKDVSKCWDGFLRKATWCFGDDYRTMSTIYHSLRNAANQEMLQGAFEIGSDNDQSGVNLLREFQDGCLGVAMPCDKSNVTMSEHVVQIDRNRLNFRNIGGCLGVVTAV